MTNLDSILKSRDITLLTKVHLSQNYGFSSSHVWMWELDYKESWALTSWCFWTVVLEKTLESPLDCKEIKPVSPKGNQPWIFLGKTDAETEAPILWPPDAKSQLIGKDPVAGKHWGQEENGARGWDGWMAGWSLMPWLGMEPKPPRQWNPSLPGSGRAQSTPGTARLSSTGAASSKSPTGSVWGFQLDNLIKPIHFSVTYKAHPTEAPRSKPMAGSRSHGPSPVRRRMGGGLGARGGATQPWGRSWTVLLPVRPGSGS